MNRFLDTVVVCPVTTTLHPQWRSRVQIRCAGKDAEIAVDQIRVIRKQRLRNRLDRLTAEEAAALRRLITEMYGE
ncbi:type II toxin-antitoxin system PemK/MazF family toxin [Candidatus Palauibacter sp.]|uniref:type II toxin-antitoxin system PemK/MazF family toxin n=1 Tax=Candidatus Palauibacter sp. TaxID=3101350 RepID=UPI003AF27B84